jgi:HSP20 family protein
MTKSTEKPGQVVPRVTRELTPFEELDQMLNQLAGTGWARPFDWRWPQWMGFGQEPLPRMDVIDREDHLLVRAEVPGLRKEDLELTLTDNHLTLKAEVREEQETQGQPYRQEIHQESFVRTLRLPAEVLADQVKAQFKDGILEVTLPKAARSTRHPVTSE